MTSAAPAEVPRVGVVGGTGRTGRAIISALSREGWAARRISHTPPRDDIRDWLHGDLADPSSLASAFAGLDALYVIPPRLHPEEAALVANAFAVAEDSGVGRLVYHSVMHPASTGVPHHVRKAHAEEVLRGTSLCWTILQSNTYMQNVFARVRAHRDGLELLSLWPLDSPGMAYVDLRDVAQAAMQVLGDRVHVHATHELAGPQTLGPRDVANELAHAWNTPVIARQVNPGELMPTNQDLRHLADHFAYHAHYSDHGFSGSPYVLEAILGRAATAFRDLANRRGRPR